jgi:NTE family protein
MKSSISLFLFVLICCLTLTSCLSKSKEKRPKIAIVFGGGGAKGAAEVGALKVIEKAGIKADYVVGTSMGSVIGGLYAAGYSAEEIEKLLLNEDWMWLYDGRKMLQFSDNRSTIGLVRGPYFREQIDRVLSEKGGHLFRHIQTPFVCVATDISNGDFIEKDLSEGVVAEAIRVSMAFPAPGNAPIDMDGLSLADGGIVNNLPVDVARRMGADVVIAIDLEQGGNDFDLGLPTLGILTKWINTRPDIPRRLKNIDDADIYIHPNLSGFNITDYDPHSLSVMIDRGFQSAMEYFDELKKIAGDK